MDAATSTRLAMLEQAATRFVTARLRHDPRYDWMLPDETAALADLRMQVAALEREEAKATKGKAA